MVDYDTAFKVAQDEKDAYRHRDILGMEDKGMEGIAYTTYEAYGKQFVVDMITGDHFVVPNKEWSGHYWYDRDDRSKYRQ